MNSSGNDSNVVEMIAIYDYNALSNQELSLKKGDCLIYLQEKDLDWIHVKKINGKSKKKHEKIGLVPSNYIAKKGTLEAEDWFFANIGRNEAEGLLKKYQNKPGTFLIRPSESSKQSYTLSVVEIENRENGTNYQPKILHFKISAKNGQFSISTSRYFKSLKLLVEHYSAHYISNSNKKLIRKPCKKIKPPVYYEWKIDKRTVSFYENSKIGEGNFAEVHRGRLNNIDVAIKVLKSGKMSKEQFLREAESLKRLRHPKLVALFGVCVEEPIYIIQEYMPYGCLENYLKQNKSLLTERERIYFCSQISSGMWYLERNNYVHRDLATRNILVGEYYCVKLCDFGLAREVDTNMNCYRTVTPQELPTQQYPPEFSKNLRYSIKSDVWSFGIVVKEIFTSGYKMVQDNFINSKTKGIPDNIKKIISDCENEIPERRPTFETLYYFFENYEISVEQTYAEYHESEAGCICGLC